jgi:hypothetical protein
MYNSDQLDKQYAKCFSAKQKYEHMLLCMSYKKNNEYRTAFLKGLNYE